LNTGKTKSCGCLSIESLRKRTREKNSSWKGGKGSINGGGYVEIRHGVNRGKLLHRVLFEEHYGVKLKPYQSLHHINGIKTDNRIENLELWDKSQPYGQRVEDKLKYYFQLVETYKSHPLYCDIIKSYLSKLLEV